MNRNSNLLCVFALLFLAGCGGGAGTTPATEQQIASGDATRTYALNGTAAALSLPPVGGFSGLLALPATPVLPGTNLTLTSSLTAPGGSIGLDEVKRQLVSPLANQSTGQLNIYFYTTLQSTTRVAFPTVPAVTVTLPATIDTTGRQFYYAVQQKPANGGKLAFRTEGPGRLSGHTVTFTPSTNPLILDAGQPYIVAFYSTFTPQPPPTGEDMYVLNGMTSITVYNANAAGDVPPIRTIDGTYLTGPQFEDNNVSGLVVDKSGYLFVLNRGNPNGNPPLLASINVFQPGANGNVPPIRKIVGANTGLGSAGFYGTGQIALDAAGNVAVLHPAVSGQGADRIDVFANKASGNVKPIRSIVTSPSLGNFYALAGNRTGEFVSVQSLDGLNGQIDVYGPGASGSAPPVRVITGKHFAYDSGLALSGAGVIAVASGGYTGRPSIDFYGDTASGNTAPVRTIASLPQGTEITVSGIAFDAAGDVAVAVDESMPEFVRNRIFIFGPNDTRLLAPTRIVTDTASKLFAPYLITFGP